MQSSYRIMHKLKVISRVLTLKLRQLIIFVSISIFFPQIGFSLPTDREKEAELSADSATLDQQDHYGEYIGHVEFQQGSTRLKAAKAITKGDEHNKLIEAIALGDKKEQAHYWMQPDINQPILHAYADTIRYYPSKHIVELVGNARIIQGENSFSSDKIIYDLLKKHLVSKGSKQKKTTIIFHPSKKDSAKNFFNEIKS